LKLPVNGRFWAELVDLGSELTDLLFLDNEPLIDYSTLKLFERLMIDFHKIIASFSIENSKVSQQLIQIENRLDHMGPCKY
jgi:hypothetical protein